MAGSNASGDEKQNTFSLLGQLYCSPDIMIAETHLLTFISVLNSFLSITAFLENALILVALRKESSLQPPSKHLLRTLTTTDLCVGLIVEPLFVTLLLVIVNEHGNICRYAIIAVDIISPILCAVSLFTLTAIRVDRHCVKWAISWNLRDCGIPRHSTNRRSERDVVGNVKCHRVSCSWHLCRGVSGKIMGWVR